MSLGLFTKSSARTATTKLAEIQVYFCLLLHGLFLLSRYIYSCSAWLIVVFSHPKFRIN
jgi:hypothetical protein